MGEKSARTRKQGDGHTKHEMNRNREASFGGALTTRRKGASDSAGKSSSRARSSKSGADRQGSVMAPRGGGSGSSGGTGSSRDARPGRAALPGLGIEPPTKSRKRGGAINRATRTAPAVRKKALGAKGRAGAHGRGAAGQKRGG